MAGHRSTDMKRTEEAGTEADCCVPKITINEASPSATAGTKNLAEIHHDFQPITGGWFSMGADDGPYPQDGEGPIREVFVDPFSISNTSVTNRQFARFVGETKYKTVAEDLGWSFVFHMNAPTGNALQRVQHTPWWCRVDGARWSSPHGPDSTHEERDDHPVVHITLQDALAYCAWAHCRLPTEAEWEYAARGGLDGQPYPWGSELKPNDIEMSNTWNGIFPNQNDNADGLIGTRPVTHYTPNSFGLFNMNGNVWEWTNDRFTHLHSPRPTKNPTGPLNGAQYVAKGGSYLCHESYCVRYRTSSRQALEPLTVADNIGFRVVRVK